MDLKLYDNTPRGWMCPQCGRAHAPSITTCPEDNSARRVWDKDPSFEPMPGDRDFDSVVCSKCGVIWKGAMGYSCPHMDCPVQPHVGY